MKIELDQETQSLIQRLFPGIDQEGIQRLLKIILRNFCMKALKKST